MFARTLLVVVAVGVGVVPDGRGSELRITAPAPQTWQLVPGVSSEWAAAIAIRVEGRGGGQFAWGTGISVGPGLVLTAAHLLDGPVLFASRCGDQAMTVRSAVRMDALDIGVLAVDGPSLHASPLAATDAPPGLAVTVVGFPHGQDLEVIAGRVEGYTPARYAGTVAPVLRFTPAPAPGQSGGALLDRWGRIVGLVTSAEHGSGVGYAVPVSTLRLALVALAPGSVAWRSPPLGAAVTPAPCA